MAKLKPPGDPRGHSLRIYDAIYDSPAFAALSPFDVLAYLALLRELKGYNNGDLSLTLTRAKKCGIHHHVTLARSLRALCAVGLVAVTRKGGCTRGGQRQPTLYRVTDRECYAMPAKLLDAIKETNDWKSIASVQQGIDLIAAAERSVKKGPVKKISPGHGATHTASSCVVVSPKTRTVRDTWNGGPGHSVTMGKKAEDPMPMRVAAQSCESVKEASHRTPCVPPLYVAIHTRKCGRIGGHLIDPLPGDKPFHFFTTLTKKTQPLTHQETELCQP